ncbi:hypothetical protein ACLK19_21575 [Escherichia coli]
MTVAARFFEGTGLVSPQTEVGRDVTLADLLGESMALSLGVGTTSTLRVALPTRRHRSDDAFLPYLIANANRLLGFEKVQADYIDFAGKQVAALAAAIPPWRTGVRTAIRQGADKVICAYRRDEDNMPGSSGRREECPAKRGLNHVQPAAGRRGAGRPGPHLRHQGGETPSSAAPMRTAARNPVVIAGS